MVLFSPFEKSFDESSPDFNNILKFINYDLNDDIPSFNVLQSNLFTKFPAKKCTASASIISWAIVLATMTGFFMAAAYVQHNDPDPYLWMPVYMVPCFINCAILIIVSLCPTIKTTVAEQFWKIVNRIITIHICYCYTLGMWTLVHYVYREIWNAENREDITEMVSEPHMKMEEAKELIGLCLVIAWLSFMNNGVFLHVGIKGIIIGCLFTGLPIISWIFVEKLEENRELACV